MCCEDVADALVGTLRGIESSQPRSFLGLDGAGGNAWTWRGIGHLGGRFAGLGFVARGAETHFARGAETHFARGAETHFARVLIYINSAWSEGVGPGLKKRANLFD